MSEKPNGQYYDEGLREEFITVGKRSCVIVEASSETARQYKNMNMKAYVVDAKSGNLQRIDGAADCEPYLVSQCLYEIYVVDGTEQRRLFIKKQIDTMPGRTIKALHDKIKKLSDLDEISNSKATLKEHIDKLQAKLTELEGGETAADPTGQQPSSSMSS